jgi:hypothetical protein
MTAVSSSVSAAPRGKIRAMTSIKFDAATKPRTLEPLTHDELLAWLHYDPTTGIFTWLVRRSHNALPGMVAGGSDGRERHPVILIGLKGRKYAAHRLAWFYMTGKWPDEEVDHWNTNSIDNRWDNLREATRVENNWNVRIKRSNTTGFIGASFDKRAGKFMATIRRGGKKRFLGYFATAEEAHAAYAAEAAYRGEFARTQ